MYEDEWRVEIPKLPRELSNPDVCATFMAGSANRKDEFTDVAKGAASVTAVEIAGKTNSAVRELTNGDNVAVECGDAVGTTCCRSDVSSGEMMRGIIVVVLAARSKCGSLAVDAKLLSRGTSASSSDARARCANTVSASKELTARRPSDDRWHRAKSSPTRQR